jgi:hypothetical protein
MKSILKVSCFVGALVFTQLAYAGSCSVTCGDGSACAISDPTHAKSLGVDSPVVWEESIGASDAKAAHTRKVEIDLGVDKAFQAEGLVTARYPETRRMFENLHEGVDSGNFRSVADALDELSTFAHGSKDPDLIPLEKVTCSCGSGAANTGQATCTYF